MLVSDNEEPHTGREDKAPHLQWGMVQAALYQREGTAEL
jgi:hypothetical protein